MQRKSLFTLSWVRKTAVFLSIVGLAGLLLYGGLQLDRYFRIRTITVKSNSKKSIYGLHLLYNHSSIVFDPESINNELVLQNPFFRSFSLTIVLPDKLIIEPHEEKPFAYLHSGELFYLLNSRGRLLQKEKKQSSLLPVITYYQSIPEFQYAPGDSIDLKDVTKTLFYIDKVEKMGLHAETVDIDSRDMVALQIGNRRIIFSLSKDENIQLYQLERIVKQFKVDGKSYKQIDLRFDKPVLELVP